MFGEMQSKMRSDPDMVGDEAMGAEESSDEEDVFLDTALDPTATPEERRSALKEAIRICVERQSGGEYESEEGGGEKKPGGLALIFGGAPKKKG